MNPSTTLPSNFWAGSPEVLGRIREGDVPAESEGRVELERSRYGPIVSVTGILDRPHYCRLIQICAQLAAEEEREPALFEFESSGGAVEKCEAAAYALASLVGTRRLVVGLVRRNVEGPTLALASACTWFCAAPLAKLGGLQCCALRGGGSLPAAALPPAEEMAAALVGLVCRNGPVVRALEGVVSAEVAEAVGLLDRIVEPTRVTRYWSDP